ncbi:MAG: hypothetical protein CL666_17100 [Balneola sp.]|nr:hypothetical protein [Balneola sp.]|tara:strand:+ start:2181 stop:2813 length:633 start_codon:yes stop_codon:yes gene_type:complete
MELRKDWSFAYFLYYLCQIGFWLFLFNACLMLVNTSISFFQEDDTFFIHDVSIIMDINNLETATEVKDPLNVNIYSTARASAGISGSFEENAAVFFYYYGLELYKYLILLISLYLLSKFLRLVAEGDPFNSKNPKYLYIIGWTLFLSSALNILIMYMPFPLLESLQIQHGFEITGISPFRDYMLEGIFIIVLGYVFKEGTRIYEEQKLTV